MMRALPAMLALAAVAACSDSVTTLQARQDRSVSGAQQLSFTVTDAPAQPGILFIAGNATGGRGSVTFTRTQYGSLCASELTAHADVSGEKLTLFVDIAERLTACTADIRALTYRAELTGLPPGNYTISVVHANPDKSTVVVFTGQAKVS